MSDQFTPTRFSRGVKLTIGHQFGPLFSIASAADGTGIDSTVEENGQFQASWIIPWTGAGGVEDEGVVAFLPWTMPPFQQNFDRATLAPPEYEVTLREISLSFDQRGEPLGIVGPGSTSAAGCLTACDMNRYDMTLSLLERTPTLVSGTLAFPYGDTLTAREVFKLDIDGVVAFGSGGNDLNIIYNNPVLATDLNVTIKPFSVYVWKLTCPGLYSASAGLIDAWSCAVGAGFVPGNTARLTVDGINYDYVVVFGDTTTTVAAGIVASAVAITAFEVYNTANIVYLIGKSPSIPSVVTSSFLAGVGTFVASHDQGGVVGTVESLALNSLNLTATFVAPLTVRDQVSDIAVGPGIQNIPTVHDGNHVGQFIPLTTPAAGAVITGTDIQNANHEFDRALRNGAGSGYGAGFGALGNQIQASNVLPAELLKNDSHYSMIIVPLWGGQKTESVRCRDVAQSGLPYIAEPWTGPTEDRRVIPVPEGFVLHHAFAVWNVYSPSGHDSVIHTHVGVEPGDLDYIQQVSVYLSSGLRSDDYRMQLVAALTFTPSTGAEPYENFLVDQFDAPSVFTVNTQIPAYRLLQVPLVCDGNIYNTASWKESGPPFFMGRSNNLTKSRSDCGDVPTSFGGSAFAPPTTAGQENILEVRWRKKNAVTGLNDDAVNGDDAVIIGQGGEWVILVGKQTVAG